MLRKMRRANQLALRKQRMKLVKQFRRGSLSFVNFRAEMRAIAKHQASL